MRWLRRLLAGLPALALACAHVQPFEAGCTEHDFARMMAQHMTDSLRVCADDGCRVCDVEHCPRLADVDAQYDAAAARWVECQP